MKIKLSPTIKEVGDMTPTTVDVISTSSSTADTSPIVLNQTDRLRFKFMPTLVNNEHESQKSVSGKLIYEKKRKKDNIFPTDGDDTSDKISRGSIKAGDWMELKLDTSETYELYQGLNMYKSSWHHNKNVI